MSRIYYFIFVSVLVPTIALRVFLYSHFHKEANLPRNVPIKFEATVEKQPKISSAKQIIEVADARIFASLYPRFAQGDRISVEGMVDDSGNMFGVNVEKVGQKRGPAMILSTLRQKISDKIFALLPQDEATLVVGSVLGVDAINKNLRDELIKTGTIHVVVVSGQNLSIVAGVFWGLASILSRRLMMAVASVSVFAYALLTGFNPPVVRAVLMVLATGGAVYFGREVKVLWSLFLAAAIIILIWPKALFEISFQLTFAATLGIVTLGRSILNYLGQRALLLGHSLGHDQKSVENLHDVGNNQTEVIVPSRASSRRTLEPRSVVGELFYLIANNAAVATSAYIFTAPIILYYFGQVSPISPLVNVLVIEAVAPIMILGFLVAAASLIFAPVAQLLAYLAFVPAFYFVKVVEFFAALNIGQINFGRENIWLVVGFYMVILALMAIFSKRRE